MRSKLLLPTCAGCECFLLFDGRLLQKRNGALLRPGNRYCLGGKKAIPFKSGDPKKYPPAWCPKRKVPCEVRVYGFKSTRDWYLHNRLRSDLGKEALPEAFRYCLEGEFTTELTPKQFWEKRKEKSLSELLPVTVFDHWVIEIDDGLKPVCFYKTEKGLEIVPYFDTARARANRKEEDT